jgi:uncharacterized membrane protein (UPF0182 family)
MPELRLVVLALQDRLAYGPTFEAALSSLFGSDAPSLSNGETSQSTGAGTNGGTGATVPSATTQPNESQSVLISQASQDFADYQRLTSEGKLADAGQKLDDLKKVLGELNSHGK